MKTEASTNKVNEKNNSTVELLSEMYRNVTMGSENLVSVIPMIKDKFLLSNVTNQIEEYASYTRETEKTLDRSERAEADKKAHVTRRDCDEHHV